VTSDRGSADKANVRRHVCNLVRTLTDKNADRVLVQQCLEHLAMIFETLGERSAAMLVRKELEGRDKSAGQVDDA